MARRTCAKGPFGRIAVGFALSGGTIGGVVLADVPVSPSYSDELSEITVTAERRSEDLQRTPVAVTAFNSDDLTNLSVQTVRDLLFVTPNLQVDTPRAADSGSTIFVIRGIGTNSNTGNAQTGVGIYVDDFYFPSLHSSLLRTLDLESLEVLRGPQGTLFGRNTIGGAIRYTSIQPSTDELSGHVEVTGGSFDRRDLSGAVNIPVSDIIAVRLTGAALQQGGFIKNETTDREEGGEKDRVLKAQVRITPTSQLTIDLVAEYASQNYDGQSYIVSGINPAAPLPFFYNLTAPPNLQYNSQFISTCRYCQPNTDLRQFSDNWVSDYRATVTWNLNDSITLKSLSGFFDNRDKNATDLDKSPINLIENPLALQRETAYTQELQAAGNSFEKRFDWITGLYFYDYNDSEDRYSSAVGSAPPVESPSAGRTKAWAVYGQGNYAFTDQFTSTVGVRGSREEVFEYNFQEQFGPFPDFVQGSSTYQDLSPLLKFQYQWTPEVMTYVSGEKGFRGGGVNVAATLPEPLTTSAFAPETVRSYEFGVRSQLLDRHLQLNATAFRMDYRNIQVTIPFPAPIGSPVPPTLTENAATARMQGVELEAAGVFGGFRLHATVTTLHAKYTALGEFEGNPPQGVNLGTPFQHAPDFSYSFGGNYDWVLPKGDVLFNLDWGYQASQASTPTYIDSQMLPAYGLLNGRVAYNYDKHWNVALAITNMLDKYYYTGGANLESVVGNAYLEPGAPREYAGTLQYKF